jgi:hypothetical protein
MNRGEKEKGRSGEMESGRRRINQSPPPRFSHTPFQKKMIRLLFKKEESIIKFTSIWTYTS